MLPFGWLAKEAKPTKITKTTRSNLNRGSRTYEKKESRERKTKRSVLSFAVMVIPQQRERTSAPATISGTDQQAEDFLFPADDRVEVRAGC